MVLPLQERLKQKGWPDKDIKFALDIFKKADEQKQEENFSKRMAPLTYWLALIITIIGNIIMTLAFVPVLFLLNGSFLYGVVAVFGVTFGMLFIFIIQQIEQMHKNHAIITAIFIPTIAIITTTILVTFSNDVARKLNAATQDPYMISITYVIAFMIPYGLQEIMNYATARRRARASV